MRGQKMLHEGCVVIAARGNREHRTYTLDEFIQYTLAGNQCPTGGAFFRADGRQDTDWQVADAVTEADSLLLVIYIDS